MPKDRNGIDSLITCRAGNDLICLTRNFSLGLYLLTVVGNYRNLF